MTKPLNTEITPLSAVTLHYTPGFVTHNLKIENNCNTLRLITSVSYDQNSGTLVMTIMEMGV